MSFPLFALSLGSIGPMELGLLLTLGILLFGRKLPDVGRSLGKTITSFREAVSGVERDPAEPAGRPALDVPTARPQRVTAAAAPVVADSPAATLPPPV